MRRRTVFKGFPLRINIALLALAIICAAIATHSDKEPLRIAFLVTGWVLTLVAVVPSLFWLAWEHVKRGKARCVEDPNIVIPGWKQFCQSMGIDKAIKMKVFPNSRNAYAKGTTIEIGQPVLDSLDSISTKAVCAHELGHIKINSALKLRRLLAVILVCAVFVGVARATVPLVFTYSVHQVGFSCFTSSVLSILMIGLMGIAIRFMSWPDEYEADLIAKQYVNREAIVSALTAIAALRKTDATRDFYLHPSITKRIANLDLPSKTRFKRWYFEL